MLDRDKMNCMTLIAGKNASATGRVLVAHNEDDGGFVVVRHGWVPPQDWAAGSVMPAEEGCAEIPQVSHTLGYYWTEYRKDTCGLTTADGFVNERGVVIVSNSMGTSRESMENADCVKDGGIGYNLRRALAERAGSAREGARILMELIDEWGYAPSGRAYTIADKDEAFMFQLVRGRHYMGARVPDDALAVMPNHYNLHSLHDCPEMFYPADLVSYAIAQGWYTPARHGDFSDFEKEGMPFCVKADHPVDAMRMADILSSHYEGTHDCCAHFGPGLSPHDASSIRYICTGTTLESDLFILRDDPRLTTVFSAFGRPCQLPYIPLHPLLGLPESLSPMADAPASMVHHLRPVPGSSCFTDTPWWRLRGIECTADMLYSSVADDLRALLVRMLNQQLDADEHLIAHLSLLLQDGDEAAARALSLESDDNAICSALRTLEDFACAAFDTVQVDPLPTLALHPAEHERVRLTLHTDHTLIPDAMAFGVAHTNVKLTFAPLLPDALTDCGNGVYTAEFDAQKLVSLITSSGRYLFILGGRCEGGKPFAGITTVEIR